MNIETLDDIRNEIQLFIDEAISKKVENEDVLILSDEEIRMIQAYRQFVRQNKLGKIFSWKSNVDDLILLPIDINLIQDPQNVSGGYYASNQ